MRKVKKAVDKAAVARKKAAAKKKARAARKVAAIPKTASAALPSGDAKAAPHPALREEFTIEARNFGPVKEAKLTLKPLTVLIGPSNTGKTYMATLASMMMKKYALFTQVARRHMCIGTPYEATLRKMSAKELQDIGIKLTDAVENGGNFVPLSFLPDKIRLLWRTPAAEAFLGGKKEKGGGVAGGIWEDVESDLGEYYGVSNVLNLVAGNGHKTFSCEFVARMNGRETSRTAIEWSRKDGMSVFPKLSDFCFPIFHPEIPRNLAEIRKVLTDGSSTFRRHNAAKIERIIDNMLLGVSLRGGAANPSAHFLPASRGGVTQAQRVMSIAMMRIGSRAGLTKIPSIPTLPKLIVDYLEDVDMLLDRLSRVQDHSGTVRRLKVARVPGLNRFRAFQWRAVPETVNVAKKIEELLGGKVTAKSYTENGGASAMTPPPVLAYRPDGMDIDLEMAQSSSMVGEIGPLVLYLKGGIEPGDTLFIEEPEAHLHPAAQTKMAEILAAMVRAGIRVVITTHSDWMLTKIANIVRRGELGMDSGEPSLTKEEVGVWFFEGGKNNGGSTTRELRYDAPPGSGDRGYIPDNLRDLSDENHNETAGLLDDIDEKARFESSGKGAK